MRSAYPFSHVKHFADHMRACTPHIVAWVLLARLMNKGSPCRDRISPQPLTLLTTQQTVLNSTSSLTPLYPSSLAANGLRKVFKS
jgi:hypothetical protein